MLDSFSQTSFGLESRTHVGKCESSTYDGFHGIDVLVTGILNASSNLATALGNGAVLGLATEGASYSTTASGARTYTSTIA